VLVPVSDLCFPPAFLLSFDGFLRKRLPLQKQGIPLTNQPIRPSSDYRSRSLPVTLGAASCCFGSLPFSDKTRSSEWPEKETQRCFEPGSISLVLISSFPMPSCRVYPFFLPGKILISPHPPPVRTDPPLLSPSPFPPLRGSASIGMPQETRLVAFPSVFF